MASDGSGWWRVFLPVMILTGLLALGGYRVGWRLTHLTESDVISAYAARYVETVGGDARVEDCVARPGRRAEVWIVVICDGGAGRFVYPADRRGRLVSASGLPET